MKRSKTRKPTTDDPFMRYLNEPKLIKSIDDSTIKQEIYNLECWTEDLKPGKFPKLDESKSTQS